MSFKIIVRTIAVILTVCQHTQPQLLQQNSQEVILNRLHQVQSRIDHLSAESADLALRFSRLLETSIRREDPELTVADISVLPSLSIPHKENLHYSVMLYKKGDYFTMRGDLIFSSPNKDTLTHSARNEHTYFAWQQSNGSFIIQRMRILNKKAVVQFEIALDLTEHSSLLIKHFSVAQMNSAKYYILGSDCATISVFDKSGKLYKKVQVEGAIRQMQKVGNNLVVLTEFRLLYFNVNRNFSEGECVLPWGTVFYFKFDEYNSKYLYLRAHATVLQVQLVSDCKFTKVFDVATDSQFFVAGSLILVETVFLGYTINTTNNKADIYYLPVGVCAGTSKLQVNRKGHSNYIISSICLGQKEVNFTHLMLQMEESSPEVTDFSRFRVPLLFLSFGIIIYVTVRNKNRKTPKEQEEERLIQQDLMRQIARMKELQNDGQEAESLIAEQPSGRQEDGQAKTVRKIQPSAKSKRN